MATTRQRPARRRRRVLRAVVIGTVACVVVACAVALRGAYDTYPGRALGPRRAPPPAWTRPCWVLHPAHASGPLSAPCARVRGTVLYVERRDPDGDGDRHLLLVARAHLVKVKYRRGVRVGRLPGVGATVTVVGRRLPHSGIPEVEPSGPLR